MKNHELIEKVGGIEKAREIVAGAPGWPVIGFCITGRNYIFKQCEYVPCGYSPLDNAWSEEYAISLVLIDDLRTAIAEHDAPEFKVGDLVVLRDSPQERVLKVQMFQDDFIRAFVGDSSDYSFGHKINFRHATPSEIQSGHREPLGNPEKLDDVVDFGYHVSPLTKVSCHHQWLSTDFLGCTEHHFICSYCGEKKTEAFGSCDHDWEDVTKPEQTERHLVCTYCVETKIQDMAIDAERWGES